MSTSVTDGNLLRMKSDFILVILVKLISDINFKLNHGLDKFIHRSNLYPHSVMGTFGVKELTAEIIKSGVKMEPPSGIITAASGGLMVLLSV